MDKFFDRLGKIITPLGGLGGLVAILVIFYQVSKQNGVIQTEITHLKDSIVKIETKFDKKFDDINQRFDKKFDGINQRLDDINQRFDSFLISQQINNKQ